jgi:hypothetical protein
VVLADLWDPSFLFSLVFLEDLEDLVALEFLVDPEVLAILADLVDLVDLVFLYNPVLLFLLLLFLFLGLESNILLLYFDENTFVFEIRVCYYFVIKRK